VALVAGVVTAADTTGTASGGGTADEARARRAAAASLIAPVAAEGDQVDRRDTSVGGARRGTQGRDSAMRKF